MNIFIPGSSIFKTYFPPLKSAEIGCVTGGSGAPVPDHYYELSRCKGASCFFREKSSPPSPFAPIHFDETQSKLPFHPLAKGKISPRLLEFRQEREKREDSCDLDPLHWNVELRSPLSLSLSSSSTHSYVEGIPNEGVARSDREFVVPLDHLQLPDSVTLSLSSIIACCVISTAVPG